MGKEFFVGWVTWEKLVFALACAIVVTVLLGCIKLVYAHWRLRKYIAMAEEERKEQALQRQMEQQQQQQRRPSGPQDGSGDVPFGIRAIESGIEVEGVWISRSNTPEPSSRDASARSSLQDHAPRRDFSLDLEAHGVPQCHPESTSNPAPAASRSARSSSDYAPSASVARRDMPPEASVTKPTRSMHPPSSYVRYIGNPYMHRRPSTLSAFEGVEAIHKASTSLKDHQGDSGSGESSDGSGNSAGDIEPITASAPRLFGNQAKPDPARQSSTDLELLNNHRLSQAAETGQLTPRVRKPSQSPSRDCSRPPRTSSSSAAEQSDYFGPQSASRPNGSAFAETDATALPATAVRSSSMPEVTPFAQFCQTAPRSPLPETSRASSMDSPRQSTAAAPKPHSHTRSASVSVCASTSAPASPRPSFEKTPGPQILRGHGTGFEVLRPPPPPPPPSSQPSKHSTGDAKGALVPKYGGHHQSSSSSCSSSSMSARLHSR